MSLSHIFLEMEHLHRQNNISLLAYYGNIPLHPFLTRATCMLRVNEDATVAWFYHFIYQLSFLPNKVTILAFLGVLF